MRPSSLRLEYEAFKGRGLSLDLSRGKPSVSQLALSDAMLRATDAGFLSEDGTDTRNYGDPLGIPECRRLFGELLGMPWQQVIVGGNSSLQMLYDALARAVLHGPLPGDTPWGKLPRVRVICPVPGYDWHFEMLHLLGIECVPVQTGADGPDMDAVRRLALEADVKGLLCVPMYGNPSGITYSDATIEALARMETAAPDFRIFYDNAYCVHHLYREKRDRLLNPYDACVRAGHPNRALLFTSTSKITYAGGGVGAMAGSAENMDRQGRLMHYQLVCHDKVNQLRHARFLPNLAAVEAHMEKHAALLRPKFELVLETFRRELSDIARWHEPLGGYFICFEGPEGCAKRTVQLCREAGVTLTSAGSVYPGGVDPRDSLLRIAPSYPPMDELRQVMELFPLAVRIAYEERRKP